MENGVFQSMKTSLRIAPASHYQTGSLGQDVFEIWFDGRLIGQITGADGPGIRLLSPHSVAKINCSGASWTLHRIQTKPDTLGVTEISLDINPSEG